MGIDIDIEKYKIEHFLIKTREEKIEYFDIEKLLGKNLKIFDESFLEKIKQDIHDNEIENYHLYTENGKDFFSKKVCYQIIESIDKDNFKAPGLYKKLKSLFYEKDFYGWNGEKEEINKRKIPILKKREIWYCKLGINILSETDGKLKYMRPVLVLKTMGNLALVLPLSKHGYDADHKKGKFYHELKGYFKDKKSYVLLMHLKTIDRKRFIDKIHKIDIEDYNNVISKIKKMYF